MPIADIGYRLRRAAPSAARGSRSAARHCAARSGDAGNRQLQDVRASQDVDPGPIFATTVIGRLRMALAIRFQSRKSDIKKGSAQAAMVPPALYRLRRFRSGAPARVRALRDRRRRQACDRGGSRHQRLARAHGHHHESTHRGYRSGAAAAFGVPAVTGISAVIEAIECFRDAGLRRMA